MPYAAPAAAVAARAAPAMMRAVLIPFFILRFLLFFLGPPFGDPLLLTYPFRVLSFRWVWRSGIRREPLCGESDVRPFFFF
jgi:hypothetical protein